MQIELSHPIQIDGTEVRVLHLRRPKVRDQILTKKQGGSEVEMEVRLFANLCEVSPATIEELDMEDYTKLQDAYTGFFEASLARR